MDFSYIHRVFPAAGFFSTLAFMRKFYEMEVFYVSSRKKHHIFSRSPGLPGRDYLNLISDKWKVLILRDLMPGTKRFGELKKSIGHVSQKVLTSQLRQMEQSGLVSRKVYAEVPPRVEYTLTNLGYSLQPIMDAMWSWGENYKKKLSAEESETA